MHDLMEALAGEGELGTDTAAELLAVLCPITAVAFDDQDAVDACRAVVQRIPLDSLLAALADWWLVVTTGATSANGLAHVPPDGISGSLRASMESLISVRSDLPASAWLARRRRLSGQMSELENRLSLDFYGKSKLPGERTVWAHLLHDLDGVIGALRSDHEAAPPEYDQKRFAGYLASEGIDQGSRRWKEMHRRAAELVRYLSEVVETQHAVRPWDHKDEVALLRQVPFEVESQIGATAALLLAPILDDGLMDSEGTIAATAAALQDAGTATDALGRARLAAIADRWIEQTGAEVPALTDLIDRRLRIEGRIQQLQNEGVDTTEAELGFIESDLDATELILSQMELERVEGAARRRVGQQLDALERRIRDSTAREAVSLSGELDDIRGSLDSVDPTEAQRAAVRIERTLTQMERESVLSEAESLLAALERLGPSEAVLFDLRREVEGIAVSEQAKVPRDLLPRMRGALEEQRLQLEFETDELIREISIALEESRKEIPAETLAELDLLFAGVREERAEGEFVSARVDAGALLLRINDSRLHRWSASEGEAALLDHVIAYCTRQLDFAEDDVRRLHVAAKTKPFVILAGLTGSGKSSLARLYAESLGATARNGQFRRVAVRPDWIDQSEVLGYVNPISNRFEPGWLAESVRRCESEPDRVFVVLLDEMNLAPVEQYLAEVLSAMEESRSGGGDVRVSLYSAGSAPVNTSEWAPSYRYPDNLLLIGTVNVDETTRPLSDRVIDRANVIQLDVVASSRHHEPAGEPMNPWTVPFAEWGQICRTDPVPDHHDLLLDIAEILARSGIGVGLRAHIELERFLANSAGVLDPVDALDLGLLQRIIPKVRGYRSELSEALDELKEELDSVGAERCAAVVAMWLSASSTEMDFIDGADHSVGLASSRSRR